MAVVLSAAVAVGVAACGDGGGSELPEAPPSPQAGSTPSAPARQLSAEEQEAVDDVLDALDSYLEVFVDLATEGIDFIDLSWGAELAQYGTPGGDELSDRVLERNHLAGHVGSGTIDWTLLDVVEVDADGSDDPTGEGTPGLKLRVCIDETEWTTVDVATREVVIGAGQRYVATVEAAYYGREFSELRPEPAWRLVRWELDRGQPC